MYLFNFRYFLLELEKKTSTEHEIFSLVIVYLLLRMKGGDYSGAVAYKRPHSSICIIIILPR